MKLLLENWNKFLKQEELKEIVGFSDIKVKTGLGKGNKKAGIGYSQLIGKEYSKIKPYIEYQEDIPNPMKVFIPEDFYSMTVLNQILTHLGFIKLKSKYYADYDVITKEQLLKALDFVDNSIQNPNKNLNYSQELLIDFKNSLQYLLGDEYYSPTSINFVVCSTPYDIDYMSPEWLAHDIIGHVLASELEREMHNTKLLDNMAIDLTPEEFKFGDETDLLPDFVVAYLKKKISKQQIINYFSTSKHFNKKVPNAGLEYAKLVINYLDDKTDDFIGSNNIGKFVFAKPW